MKLGIIEKLWYGDDTSEHAERRAAKSMAARMGRIVGAKPFPIAAQRLTTLTQDPDCSMDEVVSVLESDPGLSARLLRLVNSAGFALRTSCTSVRHAATLVGMEKLNQVASTAAIMDMYGKSGEHAATLLEHATAVGALCRYLAFHFALPADELFTCGFLHDIGKLMMIDTEGEEYLELLKKHGDFDTLYVVERERYGYDHALLAGHVLTAWNIPHPVPKVVAWHHHITRAYAESTLISQMVSTLRLADALSYVLETLDPKQEIERLARLEFSAYMDISEAQLGAMWEELRALTARARAVFRGEDPPQNGLSSLGPYGGRPSQQSLRAVAAARESMRAPALPSLRPGGMASESLAPPAVSVRPGPVSARTGEPQTPRQFPCVVCDAPSFAHTCPACRGYACPLHVGGPDDWCKLCQDEYRQAGIPQVSPAMTILLGAGLGGLVAAAFFGAASAGAQRPLRLMLGPTLVLMLLGMLVGIGQRWIRRWWFLRTRPNRSLEHKRTVEELLAGVQSPLIIEIKTVDEPSPTGERLPLQVPQFDLQSLAREARLAREAAGSRNDGTLGQAANPAPRANAERASLSAEPDAVPPLPAIPPAPGLPGKDLLPPVLTTPPRSPSSRPPSSRPRHWMSKSPGASVDVDRESFLPGGAAGPSLPPDAHERQRASDVPEVREATASSSPAPSPLAEHAARDADAALLARAPSNDDGSASGSSDEPITLPSQPPPELAPPSTARDRKRSSGQPRARSRSSTPGSSPAAGKAPRTASSAAPRAVGSAAPRPSSSAAPSAMPSTRAREVELRASSSPADAPSARAPAEVMRGATAAPSLPVATQTPRRATLVGLADPNRSAAAPPQSGTRAIDGGRLDGEDVPPASQWVRVLEAQGTADGW